MANQTNLNIANGWVSLYRSLAQSSLWISETFTRGQAWVDMLMLTNHADGFIRVRGNRVHLARGQLGWSQKRLAERWNWSRDKVKRFLNELEEDGMIRQQNSKLTSIISILNYSYYQNSLQQTNSKQVSKQHQNSTNNKENKENQVNNEKREFNSPLLEMVILLFQKSNSSKEEAEKFMDHYTANGWMINQNPMKDWKAAARNWIKRSASFSQNRQPNFHSKFMTHETDKYNGQKSDFTDQEPALTRTEQAKRNLITSVAAIDCGKPEAKVSDCNEFI